jgi:hypothetical protein
MTGCEACRQTCALPAVIELDRHSKQVVRLLLANSRH